MKKSGQYIVSSGFNFSSILVISISVGMCYLFQVDSGTFLPIHPLHWLFFCVAAVAVFAFLFMTDYCLADRNTQAIYRIHGLKFFPIKDVLVKADDIDSFGMDFYSSSHRGNFTYFYSLLIITKNGEKITLGAGSKFMYKIEIAGERVSALFDKPFHFSENIKSLHVTKDQEGNTKVISEEFKQITEPANPGRLMLIIIALVVPFLGLMYFVNNYNPSGY